MDVYDCVKKLREDRVNMVQTAVIHATMFSIFHVLFYFSIFSTKDLVFFFFVKEILMNSDNVLPQS